MGWLQNLFKKTKKDSRSFPRTRLTIDQILALGNSTEMIIELNNGISGKIQFEGFESLSDPEKILHHIYKLESEVNNGGFEQFFFNSAGDYALDTPAALEVIGANHTAELVRKAIKLVPGGIPSSDLIERREQLKSIDDATLDKLDELDSKFYKYQDPLEELQVKFMIGNKDQIKI